jgi:integrase
VLSIGALAAVWQACDDGAYGAFVRLLILTGQRREEIGGLRFDEVRDGYDVMVPQRQPAGRVALDETAHDHLLHGRVRDDDPCVLGA